MTKPVVAAVGIALTISVHTPANAQDCGELSTQLCALVSTAVANWNQHSGNSNTIETWGYTETYSVDDADSLISLVELEGTARVSSIDEDGSIFLVPLEGNAPDAFYEAERAHAASFISDGSRPVHNVTLNWMAEGESFRSVLLASESSPFIFDRTLSSVVLKAEANSCPHLRLNWLWGTQRGEILIDFEQYMESAPCSPKTRAWMHFGQAKAKLSDPYFEDGQCIGQYSWAYATPLASIGVGEGLFSFTVSGFGSMGEETGRCNKSVR